MLGSSARRPTVAIHQPECLPWLGFVDKIRQSDIFVLLDSVQFEKNYFQNRNRIRTAAGVQWLTVPVLTKGQFGQAINDVRIRTAEPWQRRHCRGLALSYGRAPFFDRYFPAMSRIYEQAWELLADFNVAVIDWLARAFGYERRFVLASSLSVEGKSSELLARLCVALDAGVYLSGVSGRDYLDETPFREAGIAVRYQEFRHPVYRQCYEPFIPQMSSLDLLFNVGPEAPAVLEAAGEGELR